MDTTTEIITTIEEALTDATRAATEARDAELNAANVLDDAARAYTKAVKDWEPRTLIYRRKGEMDQAYTALNERTNERTSAETMRDAVAGVLARYLAFDIRDRHGNAVQITFSPGFYDGERGVYAYGRFQGTANR